jgi:hypothetical protein
MTQENHIIRKLKQDNEDLRWVLNSAYRRVTVLKNIIEMMEKELNKLIEFIEENRERR